MICYLDRTFCASENCKNKCGRKLTKDIVKGAFSWWEKVTGIGENAPICVSHFCDENGELTND